MSAKSETAHELVSRGAELLDEKLPGWADQIDLESLALEHNCKCVLGQIGAREYNLDVETWEGDFIRSPFMRKVRDLRIDPSEFGFDAVEADDFDWHADDYKDGDEFSVNYAELQDAWKGEIVARRTL